jgi:hypothetical protein
MAAFDWVGGLEQVLVFTVIGEGILWVLYLIWDHYYPLEA